MNRLILGAFAAMLLLGIGLFWLQGRAEVEEAAPPPEAPTIAVRATPDAVPSADIAGLEGPAPPEASELTRDQQRFFRYDRNRDGRISRTELLSTRTSAFRKLDKDGNNLLTFEEWAITTVERFQDMDQNGDGVVRLPELTAYYRKRDKD